jgi:hypothetical protein
MHLLQFVILWNLVVPTELNPQQADTIVWNLTRHDTYTVASAYKAQFVGFAKAPEMVTIWATWAPKNANSSHGSFYKIGCGLPTD